MPGEYKMYINGEWVDALDHEVRPGCLGEA
jgi:hypothetical protein